MNSAPQDWSGRHVGGFHVLDRDPDAPRIIYWVRCEACGEEKKATSQKLSRVSGKKSRMSCATCTTMGDKQ